MLARVRDKKRLAGKLKVTNFITMVDMLLLLERAIIESVIDQLKNISQIGWQEYRPTERQPTLARCY